MLNENITSALVPTRRAYSLAEVSGALLPVPINFLRLEISRGNLTATRLGRRVVVTAEEIARYIAAGANGLGNNERPRR
jgi:hypothetical protein